MSPCHCLTETRKVGSEGVLVHGYYSRWYSDGALRLNNTHIIPFSLCASIDVRQALCLDTQHTLSACYGPTQVTV